MGTLYCALLLFYMLEDLQSSHYAHTHTHRDTHTLLHVSVKGWIIICD